MLKKSLLFAAACALSMLVGCATPHARARKLTASSMTAVRLDEVIRARCNTSSAVTPVFEFSSSALTDEAKTNLNMVATCFATGPLKNDNLRLVGFTDPQGSRSANYELGLDRAEAVATYLERQGVSRTKLSISSRGEEGASPDPARWPADRIVDLSVGK